MGKKDSPADSAVLFFIMVIGAAEAAHLSGVFFHRSVSQCTIIFGILGILSAAALGIYTVCRARGAGKGKMRQEKSRLSAREGILLVIFALLAVSQILFIVIGRNAYVQGDMTVETVGSFLKADAVYQVNPMTGRAYEEGLPLRIEILCLPTLYAALSSMLSIRPDMLVLYGVPVVVLLCCYGAYSSLAEALFPDNRGRRLCFLITVALLIWIGSCGYGMDGFGLLFSGWRGVTIRNTVLIPYTVSLCLRRKYAYLPFCVLAELCIAWTLYGLGACLAVVLGMVLTGFLRRVQSSRKEAADGGAS